MLRLPCLSFLAIGVRSDAIRMTNVHRESRQPFSNNLFRDAVATRTLTSATFTNTTGMTVEACVGFCDAQSFIYAGVEFAQECCEYALRIRRLAERVLIRICRLW